MMSLLLIRLVQCHIARVMPWPLVHHSHLLSLILSWISYYLILINSSQEHYEKNCQWVLNKLLLLYSCMLPLCKAFMPTVKPYHNQQPLPDGDVNMVVWVGCMTCRLSYLPCVRFCGCIVCELDSESQQLPCESHRWANLTQALPPGWLGWGMKACREKRTGGGGCSVKESLHDN